MPNPAERSDLPRRFYKAADVRPAPGGFSVSLDGRGARTPKGAALIVPSAGLAALLVEEWSAQTDQIEFAAMPATRLAFTAIDATATNRDAVAGSVAKLVGADLLSYFADGPASLIERQEQLWGPWLSWAERHLDLVLIRAKGVSHQTQPQGTIERAKALAAAENDFGLTGLAFAGGLYGSAVLAFAAKEGALDGDAAFDLSRLDEAFQEERWGIDDEAARRTGILRKDAHMIDAWFAALQA
jgi:chaperone required for assembly of F1-ATPase